MEKLDDEKVFEVLGEDGSMKIMRHWDKKGETYIYYHSEFDPTEEGIEIDEKVKFKDFESAFRKIDDEHQWHLLHIQTVHKDFRNIVLNKLTDKLQKKGESPEEIDYMRNRLEKVFEEFDEAEKTQLI